MMIVHMDLIMIRDKQNAAMLKSIHYCFNGIELLPDMHVDIFRHKVP